MYHHGSKGSWKSCRIYGLLYSQTSKNIKGSHQWPLDVSMSWRHLICFLHLSLEGNTFHKHQIEIYNKHFPKIRIKRKYNNKKPWLSEGLQSSIKQKNKLYLKFKKANSACNDELYKSYKKKLQHLMKVTEKHHYPDLLVKYINNMKKSWVVIKSIINGWSIIFLDCLRYWLILISQFYFVISDKAFCIKTRN